MNAPASVDVPAIELSDVEQQVLLLHRFFETGCYNCAAGALGIEPDAVTDAIDMLVARGLLQRTSDQPTVQ